MLVRSFTGSAVSPIDAAMSEQSTSADAGVGQWTVEEIAGLLAPLPIVARLDAAALAAVAARCGFGYLHAGDVLMQEGQVSNFAAVILMGEVCDVFVDTTAADGCTSRRSARHISSGSWARWRRRRAAPRSSRAATWRSCASSATA